jgi:hypothetical protein
MIHLRENCAMLSRDDDDGCALMRWTLAHAIRTCAAVTLAGILSFADAAPHADSSWWQISAALDYTPHGTQPGLVHALLSSDNCAGCHAAQDTSYSTFFPWDTWAGSMMANATRDPVFWAALDVANHDQPGVGDYCLRCHTPSAWYGGRVVKTGSGTVDGSNGCLLQGNYTSGDNDDYSGESCHFCHRLENPGPQGQAGYHENANAWLDDGDCNGAGQPCRRGPYTYVSGDEVDPPPHPWAYSIYHQQSEICGVCHNVTTPDTSAGPLKRLIGSNGVDSGIAFPVERTFSEWQQSDFGDLIFRDRLGDAAAFTPALARGEQCQACHMPTSTDPNAYACTLALSGSRSGSMAVHSFAGGNAWVPNILGGQYGDALFRTSAYAQTITAAQQMLQGAAQVAITPGTFTAPTASLPGAVALSVRVINLSGHKLPTGYSEGRRMWLNVQVRDASSALIAESGAYDAMTGVLTQDAQARVYETLQGMWDSSGGGSCRISVSGAAQFHFVLNNCIAKDNRIPPLGFAGGSNLETMPVAYSYPPTGAARLVNYDDVAYSFSVPAATPLPLSVSATLFYQTSSKDYIEFLNNEAQANAFADENTMCSGSPGRPFAVGPQARTRALYLYQLWNNAANDATQPGYGKSPPVVAGNVAGVIVGN